MKRIAAILIFPVLVCWIGAGAAVPPKPAYRETPGEGADLAKEIISRPPAKEAEAHGTLTIRNPETKRTRIPVTYLLRGDGKHWEDVYETHPTPALVPGGEGGILIERLVVTHAPAQPNKYLFAKASDGSKILPDPVVLPPDKIDVAFANSDFWLSDLGLEFLHWPSQRVIAREFRNNCPCKVLESLNPNPSVGGYYLVKSWIDEDYKAPIIAEGYDKNGKLIKKFAIKSVTNGEISEMQITNDKTDSKTILEYEVKAK